jgi:hypothetical protein
MFAGWKILQAEFCRLMGGSMLGFISVICSTRIALKVAHVSQVLAM